MYVSKLFYVLQMAALNVQEASAWKEALEHVIDQV